MARGMANGEPIVSQAQTKEFDEGYKRVFGDKPPQRGKWVALPDGSLVPADQYVPEPTALDAPIMAGRFYENTQATDGTDIGSRSRHKRYMREHGLTTVDDYTDSFRKAQEARAAVKQGRMPDKTRREAIARAMYKLSKP